MKKSEILEADLRRRLDSTFDPRATAWEIVAAFEGAAEWDPEEPKLPKRLRLDIADARHSQLPGAAEAYINTAGGTDRLPVAEVHQIDPREPAERRRRLGVAKAMVAAYNREREEERIEAEIDGAKLDEGLARICREEIDAEIRAAADAVVARWRKIAEHQVQVERARCLGVFDWLLSVIPQGWDFVRCYAEAARRKLESGEAPGPARDWLGADDLPTEVPREWPERLPWHRLSPGCHALEVDGGVADEIERRWLSEPKLRLWKSVTTGLLEAEREARERLRKERDGAAAEREHYRREALDLGDRVSRAMGVISVTWNEAWHRAVAGDHSGAIKRLYEILTGVKG